jgi:hypothetical protein
LPEQSRRSFDSARPEITGETCAPLAPLRMTMLFA